MHLSRNELLLHCNRYYKGCQNCFKFSHNSSSIHIIYPLSLSVPSFLPSLLCWIVIWCTAIYCTACYSMIRKSRATWRWTLCSVLKTHFDPMWRKRWVRLMHTSVYLYMYMHVYIYAYTDTYIYIHLYICTCICMCIYMYSDRALF